MRKSEFRFVDLFSGIGGFHHALAAPEFGGECVLAVDIDEECRKVYRATWPDMEDSQVQSDIRNLTLTAEGKDRPIEELAQLVPDHDVLCAGFPCQPFSKSGAQLGDLDSARGTLYFDIFQIVRAKLPRFIILENVRNLAGPRHTHTWESIIAGLRSLGYTVSSDPIVLSPHSLPPWLNGRPQSRDRVFILAERSGPSGTLEGDLLVKRGSIEGWDTSNWNIEDYLDEDDSIEQIKSFQLRAEETAWLNAWQAFVQGIPEDSLPGFPIWVDAFTGEPDIPAGTPKWKENFLRKNSDFYLRNKKFIQSWLRKSWIIGSGYRVADFPASRRKFEWQARQSQPARNDRDIWKLTIHLRPSGIRVRPATYLPALVAITQTSIIGSRRRRITPVEAGRLQGIPDHVFQIPGLSTASAYKQAGNGVNVGVVQFVARALFEKAGLNWGTSHQGDEKTVPHERESAA